MVKKVFSAFFVLHYVQESDSSTFLIFLIFLPYIDYFF